MTSIKSHSFKIHGKFNLCFYQKFINFFKKQKKTFFFFCLGTTTSQSQSQGSQAIYHSSQSQPSQLKRALTYPLTKVQCFLGF